MTTLKLSLGDQFVWALVQPTARDFIKETDESGYQATQLILSQSQPGPVEVVYENLPGWAQKQVAEAIKSGQLTNAGDKIEAKAEKKAEAKKESSELKASADEQPKNTRKTTKKKTSSKKTKVSSEA